MKINEWINKPITWKDSIIAALVGSVLSLCLYGVAMLRLKIFKY